MGRMFRPFAIVYPLDLRLGRTIQPTTMATATYPPRMRTNLSATYVAVATSIEGHSVQVQSAVRIFAAVPTAGFRAGGIKAKTDAKMATSRRLTRRPWVNVGACLTKATVTTAIRSVTHPCAPSIRWGPVEIQ